MHQGQMLARVAVAGSLSVGSSLPAQAAMILISRDTELSASGQCAAGDTTCTFDPNLGVLIGRHSDSYTGFGSYSNAVGYPNTNPQEGSAAQDSSISSTDIKVNTSASAHLSFGAASSAFTLKFSLDAPEQFTLTDFGQQMYIGQSTLVQFQGPGVNFSDGIGDGNPLSGTLAAGAYTLFVQSTANSQGISSFGSMNSELQLTPVPLPDSLVLVISGAMVVGLLTRRRQSISG